MEVQSVYKMTAPWMKLDSYLPRPCDLSTSTNPKAETSNIMMAPYTHSDRDSMRQPGSSLTDTLSVAKKSKVATNYSKRLSGSSPAPNSHLCEFCLLVHYRIYAGDKAIPSKTPVAAGDPFLGRIKARSVPPPCTVKAVKGCIAEAENIKRTNITIFLTSYSQSPMNDEEKVTVLNGTGPGSTPQEPLALVIKMSDSERSALESDGRSGLASAAEPDTTSPEIPYGTFIQHSLTFLFVIFLVFYRIYAEDGAIPSMSPVTPGDPFLGRIKVRSVPPPLTAKTVKCSIAKVENIKDGESISLFLTPYSQSPMDNANNDIILNRTGNGPGSTPQEPLALVAKMSHSERSALESEGRSGLASAAEPNTTSPEIRYGAFIQHSPNVHL